MTATLEQTQAELLKFIGLAQKGEEVIIVSAGRPLAKLTALPESKRASNRQAWLARLAELRTRLATGKTGPTTEELLNEDRGD